MSRNKWIYNISCGHVMCCYTCGKQDNIIMQRWASEGLCYKKQAIQKKIYYIIVTTSIIPRSVNLEKQKIEAWLEPRRNRRKLLTFPLRRCFELLISDVLIWTYEMQWIVPSRMFNFTALNFINSLFILIYSYWKSDL